MTSQQAEFESRSHWFTEVSLADSLRAGEWPGLFKLDSLGAACNPFLLAGRHDVVRGSRAILGGSYGTVCSAEVRMKD
jgi:hypothetical protein